MSSVAVSSSATRLASSSPAGPSPPLTATNGSHQHPHHQQQRASQATNCRHAAPTPSVPSRTDTAPHTCFYFTVFFSNNPPIFHSNRIPTELLGIGTAGSSVDSNTPSCATCQQQQQWQQLFTDWNELPANGCRRAPSIPGSVNGSTEPEDVRPSATVGDFRNTSGEIEEVPQQTLQNVAFPTAFGSCGGGGGGVRGGGPCPLPYRALAARNRSNKASASDASASSPTGTTQLATAVPGHETSSVSAFSGTAPAAAYTSSSLAPRLHPRTAAAPVAAASTAREKEEETAGMNSSVGETDSGTAVPLDVHMVAAPLMPARSRGSSGVMSQEVLALSPNTMPLSSSSTVHVSSSSTATTAGAAPSAVPTRFQPTFPVVTWDDEDPAPRKRDTAAALGKSSASATVVAANGTAAASTPPPAPPSPAAPAKAPPAATLARSRRPRPKATEPSAETPAAPAPVAAATSSLPTKAPASQPGPASSASLVCPPSLSTGPVPSPVAGKASAPAATATAAPRPMPTSASPVAAAADTVTVIETANTHAHISQEGPPWNMRLEEVRSAKGELRYYRIILAVSFAALITSHTGLMHSMQTRNAATALVLTCPPSGVHFRYLLHHVDILRSVLNRTTEFAIRTVQRFFGLLFSPTQKPKGSQPQVLKGIAGKLETHPEARDTYQHVKAELASALGLRFPLPLLAPPTSGWVAPVLAQTAFVSARVRAGNRACAGTTSASAITGRRARAGLVAMSWLGLSSDLTSPTSTNAERRKSEEAPPPPPPLSSILYDATAYLRDYSEGFASAFVCGLLSLTEEAVSGPGSRSRVKASTAASSGGAALQSSGSNGNIHGVVTSSRAASPTAATTREASAAYPAFPGECPGTTTPPEWLACYASYFNTVAVSAHRRDGVAEAFVELSKPDATPRPLLAFNNSQSDLTDGSGQEDEDTYLRTHVSASTVSSITPVLSPLTIDVEARSPSARFARSRFLNNTSNLFSVPAVSSTAAAAAPPTPTTAQLYMVSAETSITSHAATLAAATEGVSGLGHNACNTHNSSGDAIAGTSSVSRPLSVGQLTPAAPPPPSQQQQQQQQQLPPPPPLPQPPSPSVGREDEYYLHRRRLGRVVVFTQDATLARRLLLVAAFLWSDCTASAECGMGGRRVSASGARRSAGVARNAGLQEEDEEQAARSREEAQRMYETAVAAAVSSADFANVPIQWVAEEFTEARLRALCSRFSPENTLLVVVPRQLQCRRVSLRKHVAGTTVLVEQHSGREARIRSEAFPFRCRITKQTVLQPDPTVTTLLREACSLHQGSQGAVDFAEVFQRMVSWLHWQSAAALLKKRDVHNGALSRTRAAAGNRTTPLTPAEPNALSRLGSADLLWPSRSVSAYGAGSRTTTPVTPVPASTSAMQRIAVPATTTPSSSTVMGTALEQSWTLDSAEELLLPGSRGAASAAWAYAANPASSSSIAAAAAVASNPAAGTATATAAMPSSLPLTTTSTLLVSHGLLQPPSAFVTASPTTASTPVKSASSSVRFFNWFKSSPTSKTAVPLCHPVLSPTTLGHLYTDDGGGQLPRLLAEDGDDDLDFDDDAMLE